MTTNRTDFFFLFLFLFRFCDLLDVHGDVQYHLKKMFVLFLSFFFPANVHEFL